MKKIARYVVLGILSLIAFCLCGTLVLKIYSILFSIEFTNLWTAGFKTGFLGWLLFFTYEEIQKRKAKKEM